jgi:hypothetical protein
MRRILIAMVVISVVSVTALLVGRSAPGMGAAQAATTTDITYDEGLCNDAGAHCKALPVQGDALAFGARLIFSIPLSATGHQIGREVGECVNLTKASRKNYCTFNIRLAGGQVSVQGVLPYVGGVGGTIPVTGGTGAYEGAYGHLQLLKTPSVPARYQLHVVTP